MIRPHAQSPRFNPFTWLSHGLLAAATVLGVAPQAAAKPKATELVIQHAKLHVGDGTVIEDATVVVDDGRIKRVAAGLEAAGTHTIDAKGQWLTPGLIVAGASLGLVEISLEASTRDDEWEDHGPIRAGYDPSTAIFADSSLLAIQATAGVTTAAVSPSGGLLAGSVTWVDLLHGQHRELVAQSKIAIAGSLGHNHGDSRAATLQLLRSTLADARYLRRNRSAYERGQSRELVAHHLDLEALYPVLDRKQPLFLSANRASDLLTIVDLVRKERIKVVIVGAAEGWKVADDLAAAKIPVLVQPTTNLPSSFDQLGARADNAALLDAAGVKVLIAEIGSAHNARNITQQAGIAVAHGLPYNRAISAITLHVAEAFGMERNYGSVASGKVANLVLWPGDPLELWTAPTQVVIRGQLQPMKSRQTLLRDRYRDLSRFKP